MEYPELEQAILDLGPSTEFVSSVYQNEPGDWLIECDDDEMVIRMTCGDGIESVALSSKVGSLDDGNRMEIMLSLLAINANSCNMEGLCLGLEDEGDGILQFQNHLLSDFSLHRLQEVLKDFYASALHSREWLQNSEGPVPDTSQSGEHVTRI